MPEVSTETVLVTRLRLGARVEAVAPARAQFVAWLGAQGLSAESVAGWELVFSEALTNAVVHGSPPGGESLVEARWWRDGDRVHLEVDDRGPGPVEDRAAEPLLPDDPLATHGRGLFLIHQLCDRVEHRAGRSGHTLALAKASPEILAAPPPSCAEVDAVVAELAVAYEGLDLTATLLRGLVDSKSLGALLESLRTRLGETHGFATAELWLLEPQLFECDPALEQTAGIRSGAGLSARQIQLVRAGRESVWAEPRGRPAAVPEDWAQGAILPMGQENLLYGALVAARGEGTRSIKGADLSLLRTAMDIAGLACEAALLRHTRDREQQALGEWQLATSLQRALIPLKPPPVSARWEILLERRTAREVSGDHALARVDRHGRVFLALADVMGKGGTAAMLAVVFRALMETGDFDDLPLVEAAARLNNDFIDLLSGQVMFLTCALARVDPVRRLVEVVNAGHCPPLLLRGGAIAAEVPAGGPPLGVFAEAEYEGESLPLGPGDRLLLVTDGCYEWTHGPGQFGWDRLRALVEAHATAPLAKIWERLQGLQDKDAAAADDQTVLYYRAR